MYIICREKEREREREGGREGGRERVTQEIQNDWNGDVYFGVSGSSPLRLV